MTTPQSGREAFEVLNAAAKGAGHLSFESMRQCADAWIAVTNVLDDVADGWTHGLGTGDELAADAIRALAQQGRSEARTDALWCLHVQGPDDMHPAPSKAHAELGAHLLNEWVSSLDAKDEGYPGIEGVVAIWPHSPEAHAAEAGEFAERFIYPSSLTCGKVAQQGREVGDQTCCDRAYKDGYDTGKMHAATKQQAVEVTEDMVEAACEAYFDDGVHGWSRFAGTRHTAKLYRKAMRAALLAALTGKTEVDRG